MTRAARDSGRTMMTTMLPIALTLVLAAAGCFGEVDVEKVPVGAEVQVTRQDGGVVQGTLAAHDDEAVEVKVGSGHRLVPRDEVADVQVVADTPFPLPAMAAPRVRRAGWHGARCPLSRPSAPIRAAPKIPSKRRSPGRSSWTAPRSSRRAAPSAAR